MCKAMEEMCNEAARDRSIQIARLMLSDGEPHDKIVRYTGLTLEEVQSLDIRQPA